MTTEQSFEYFCSKCNNKITNESCVSWKRRHTKDVYVVPYCKWCQAEVAILSVQEATIVKRYDFDVLVKFPFGTSLISYKALPENFSSLLLQAGDKVMVEAARMSHSNSLVRCFSITKVETT